MKKHFIGINIQFPITRLILSGEKTVETRTYPLPNEYVDTPVAIVETPGEEGDFKARIVAIAIFGPSFKYPSNKAFYADSPKHRVEPGSKWAWDKTRGKWGWPIKMIQKVEPPQKVSGPKGIRYTKQVALDL